MREIITCLYLDGDDQLRVKIKIVQEREYIFYSNDLNCVRRNMPPVYKRRD